MTIIQTLEDLFTGNVSHAWSRVSDWMLNSLGLPPWLVDLISKALGAEFKILQGLVEVAKTDLSTASSKDDYVAAAKDVLAKLIEQNISTFSLQYIFAMINAAVDG